MISAELALDEPLAAGPGVISSLPPVLDGDLAPGVLLPVLPAPPERPLPLPWTGVVSAPIWLHVLARRAKGLDFESICKTTGVRKITQPLTFRRDTAEDKVSTRFGGMLQVLPLGATV